MKRLSLAALPPVWRLALVFGVGMFFIFINNLVGAALLMAFGLILFLANDHRNWALALSAPFSGVMLIMYNTILSPVEAGGWHWAVFTVNPVGFTRGLVVGMRLMGTMLIGFAWLSATPIPEMYEGLAWLKPARAWVLGLLRGIQIMRREFVALTQSLIMRGLKWDSPAANIRNLVPLSQAIIPRIIDNSQKGAFASQSHQRAQALEGNGGVVVEDAHVRYAPKLPDVLEGINLKIEPGEFVYLAGKSAAGKTSLLRVMGGVISWIMGEFRGRILVDGRLTHETPLATLCRTVRYVAPDPFASIHGLTVGQEIMFLASDERQARESLDVMGIAHLWERETTKLSGGQQVRLVLAGALVSGAQTFLLDSPMQELDPDGRAAFLDALGILRSQRGCGIIIADPFWRELENHIGRVLVLENRKLIAEAPPTEFFNSGGQWLDRCNLRQTHLERLSVTPGDVTARLEGVHVTLEGNPILHGVDFAIRQGELTAIMGPNGSGKTTAMLTLAGAIRPTKGRVNTNGHVGYIFQNAALQTLAMTAEEELSFGPRILRWPVDETKRFVQDGLAWTNLAPDDCPLDLHPADLRMLAIAACNTRISTLILDEPTVGLDTAGIAKINDLIRTLRTQGKAVVVITHDREIAAQADRIVTIQDGRVHEELN
jgi:energy-coupling factor transport system ATP-binding protein